VDERQATVETGLFLSWMLHITPELTLRRQVMVKRVTWSRVTWYTDTPAIRNVSKTTRATTDDVAAKELEVSSQSSIAIVTELLTLWADALYLGPLMTLNFDLLTLVVRNWCTGQSHETINLGSELQKVQVQGHTRPEIALEAWRRHHWVGVQ